MKKFTLIIAVLAIAFIGKAETDNNIQKKVLKLKAKTDLVLHQNANNIKHHGNSNGLKHTTLVQLKSAEMQKLDSVVSWTYDKTNSIWNYDWKDVYEYDEQMRSTVWAGNEWNIGTSMWETDSKTEIEYENNGNLSSILISDRDEQSNELMANTKMEVYLNPNGKMDSTITYFTETGDSWMFSIIQKYFYNGSGQITMSEMWMIEEDDEGEPTGQLVKSVIYKYDYNGSGKISKVSESYILEGEELPFSQTEYSYNASGQLTTSVYSSLNFFTFTFEKSEKTDFSYNAAGDLSVEINSEWNSANGTWVESYKYENTYNNQNFSDVIFPAYIDMIFGMGDPEFMMFMKVIVSDKTFEKIGDNWVQTDKSTFYYSSGTTNVIDFDNPSISFYPNPASENIMLKWNGSYENLNVQIFQINGAKVMEQIAYPEENISVSNLVRGMYLVKLQSGQQTVYTGKLVKK